MPHLSGMRREQRLLVKGDRSMPDWENNRLSDEEKILVYLQALKDVGIHVPEEILSIARMLSNVS